MSINRIYSLYKLFICTGKILARQDGFFTMLINNKNWKCLMLKDEWLNLRYISCVASNASGIGIVFAC